MVFPFAKPILVLELFFRLSAAFLILDLYYLHYWRYHNEVYQFNVFYTLGGIFSALLALTLIVTGVLEAISSFGKRAKGGKVNPHINIKWNIFTLLSIMILFVFLLVINPFGWFSIGTDFLLLSTGILITLSLSILLEILGKIYFGKLSPRSKTENPYSTKLGKISSILVCVLLLGTIFIPFQTTRPHFAKDVNSTVLFSQGEEEIHTYRIPSLLVIPKGSHLNNSQKADEDIILAFCEARYYSAADWGKTDIGYRRSSDGGNNWSPIELLLTTNNATDNIRILSPTVVFDEITGITWLFYTQAHVVTREGDMYLLHSLDGGENWSETPQNMTTLIKMVGPGHGIQLKNGPQSGRLVVPGYANGPGSFVIYSDDHGDSWQMGNRANTNGECEVAETTNGSIYMIIRNSVCNPSNGEGCVKWVTWSHDGGITWEPTRPEPQLIDPKCMASIHQIPSIFQTSNQGIIFSGPGRVDDRSDLTIRLRLNETQAWSFSKILYYGPSGYSDLGAGSEGTLYCFFEQGIADEKEHLTLASFNIDWLD